MVMVRTTLMLNCFLFHFEYVPFEIILLLGNVLYVFVRIFVGQVITGKTLTPTISLVHIVKSAM